MHRVTLSFPWPFAPSTTRQLLRFGFQVSILTYVALLVADRLWPGFVSLVLNMQIMTEVTVALGLLSAAWPVLTERIEAPHLHWGWIIDFGLAVGGGLITYLQSQHLAVERVALTMCTVLLIFACLRLSNNQSRD